MRSISEIIEPESEHEDEDSPMIVEVQKSEATEVKAAEELTNGCIENGKIENNNVNKSLVPETDF